MRRNLVKDSKFLSLVLRHDPSVIGITLDEAGWVEVDRLLEAVRPKRPHLNRERLVEIVETNDKKRFAFSEDKMRIRASQGHSIGVELGLKPQTPPACLFHGTADRNIPSIRESGLLRGSRDHVHLSEDEATAVKVGTRHGKPIVLKIDAAEMVNSGFTFFLSENGVWLTAHVPPAFIDFG